MAAPKKQQLFIYERKEMGMLFLLAAMVAIFAFTLGIHLGKRVTFKVVSPGTPETTPIETLPDRIPDRPELSEQRKGADQAVDEVMDRELHNEVTKSGIKLETPRQVDLPEKTVGDSGGATTLTQAGPHGKFVLQVGSHPEESEANAQLEQLRKQGLTPFMKQVELQGKGRWYRVYLGGYSSKEAAESAGTQYRLEHKIRSYIIGKDVE